MRTTLDLDGSVLAQLKEHQRREGKSLGELASELLAKALAEVPAEQEREPLDWIARPMGARVDLEDRDAVERLSGGRYEPAR
jgi:hypothetical protein